MWPLGEEAAKKPKFCARHIGPFANTYEGMDVTNWIGAVSVQPLAADQGFMPHMIAKEVFFHFLYGSLICSKRLQSDRPKCKGLLVDPRAF